MPMRRKPIAKSIVQRIGGTHHHQNSNPDALDCALLKMPLQVGVGSWVPMKLVLITRFSNVTLVITRQKFAEKSLNRF